MSRVEIEIIKEKIFALMGYYSELKELENISYEEYIQNKLYKRSVERLLQLVVEVASDINNLILKGLGFSVAMDYYSTFIELAESGVLPMDFALEIAPSTGLRNIIVHEYQKINDQIVYAAIADTLKYYKKYMKYINDYLR